MNGRENHKCGTFFAEGRRRKDEVDTWVVW